MWARFVVSALLAVGLLGLATRSQAQEPATAPSTAASDEWILGGQREQGLAIDSVRFRTTVYAQEGEGYESRTGRDDQRGSLEALVLQPMLSVGIRQSQLVHHEVLLAVDIVSSASTNAIDILSSASGVNETVALELHSSFELSNVDTLSTTLGGTAAEPVLYSGSLGAGYRRSLADDNAALELSAVATLDSLRASAPDGYEGELVPRRAFNFNAAFSQLLTQFTVLDAGYGITHQTGTLHTTYLTVPTVAPTGRLVELFPAQRTRHALTLAVSHHLPLTRTSLRPTYRFYIDDIGIRAHTAELLLNQYIQPWLFVGPSYRFHTQTGASFYAEGFPSNIAPSAFRTSDSDLAPFVAHRIGAKLAFLASSVNTLDVSYYSYHRSNGLSAQIFSLGYSGRF